MKKETLLEILDAAHLTKHIHSEFKQRGGILLIGPPASLKTTFVKNVFEEHYDALVMGDVNIQTLVKMKEDIRCGRFSTFAFTEFEKLYQRRGDTAQNLEGSIKMLVEEGFDKPSFKDQRIASSHARCLVVAALTSSFYERKYEDWQDSGFLRRFLVCNIALSNPQVLMDSISKWELYDLGTYKVSNPGNRSIPYVVTDAENHLLRRAVKEQPGEHTPFVLLKKIMCVLHWKYDKEDKGKALAIMKDFTPCLTRDGDEITL